MDWIEKHLLDILNPLIGGGLGYFLGRKRQTAEIESIEAQNESVEVQTLLNTIKSLEGVNETLLKNINELQQDLRHIKVEFDSKCKEMQKEIDELRSKL